MTPSCLIISLITLIWIKGVYLSKEKQVFQTPRDLLEEPNSVVVLNLTHLISSYDTILWYQRSPGDTSLKLIGYMWYKTPKVETQFEGRFKVSGDGEKTAFLHILNLTHPDDSGEYFGAASNGQGAGGVGEAYFGGGTKLTVLEKGREVTPPTNESVKVFGPSPFECRNLKDDERKKTLLCVVSGFYPDHVSVFWQVNGENETKGVATDNAAQWMNNSTEFYRITSRLRVPADDWNNPKNEFTCIISFFDGNDTTHYQNSIRGVEAQTKGVMTRDNYLRITQSAKLSYGVFIIKSTIYGAFVALVVWKLQGSTGKQKH